jgi:hypothetical protein
MMGNHMVAKSIPVLLLTALISLVALPAASAQGDVAVVVNPANPISNFSLIELRKIFTGERHSWQGGLSIHPIVRRPGCHERLVLLHLLGMSESQYKQYWTAQVFRGEASSEPPSVPSVGMQKEAMQVFPGAISLVDATDVKPGMKIVKVEGYLPGESGYPLH